MLNKFQRKFDARRREAGNTFVFTLLFFPVFFACFALAADVSIAQYTRTTLQADLDAAVQSAVGQSNPTATAATNFDPAKTRFLKIYSADRRTGTDTSNTPFVLCQGTDIPYDSGSSGTNQPGNGCGYKEVSFTFLKTGRVDGVTYNNVVRAHVIEYSKTMFLGVLGIDNFKYDLVSRAHLAQSYYSNR